MAQGENSQKEFGWPVWILIFCALSFLMLGLDVVLNHRNILDIRLTSLIPIIFSPISIAFCIIAVLTPGWRRFSWIAGLAAIAVGLGGTIFHWASSISQRYEQTIIEAIIQSSRPALAPAAFASTGLLLLLVAWAERRR